MSPEIYVASSWRNPYYDGAILSLKQAGLSVYDFKHPAPGREGFSWRTIDPNWGAWTPAQYRDALEDLHAEVGFALDMTALRACRRLVYVLPCGRSASLELGIAIGMGKETFVYIPQGVTIEAELMFKAATRICLGMNELLEALQRQDNDAEENLR